MPNLVPSLFGNAAEVQMAQDGFQPFAATTGFYNVQGTLFVCSGSGQIYTSDQLITAWADAGVIKWRMYVLPPGATYTLYMPARSYIASNYPVLKAQLQAANSFFTFPTVPSWTNYIQCGSMGSAYSPYPGGITPSRGQATAQFYDSTFPGLWQPFMTDPIFDLPILSTLPGGTQVQQYTGSAATLPINGTWVGFFLPNGSAPLSTIGQGYFLLSSDWMGITGSVASWAVCAAVKTNPLAANYQLGSVNDAILQLNTRWGVIQGPFSACTGANFASGVTTNTFFWNMAQLVKPLTGDALAPAVGWFFGIFNAGAGTGTEVGSTSKWTFINANNGDSQRSEQLLAGTAPRLS